jgi:asparagine synthase (glutamine-hydrolysing)
MLIPDNNLPYYESLASLFSIEMRYPFLDNRLVDFMLKIPMSLKLKNWTTKYILRRLLRKKLPKAVVSRQKHGLSSPIKIWIKKEMKDIFMSRLNEASLKQYPYLNQAYVKQLFKEHLERKADNSRKIWCLFCFVVWHSKYFGEG